MTDQQRAALAARLAQPDLAGLGDDAAAAALNVAGTGAGAVFQEVPSVAVFKRLAIDESASVAGLSAWGLIEINARRAATTALTLTGQVPLAASNPSAADRIVAHLATLVRWIETFDTIDATDEAVRTRFAAIFAVLVAAGWITTGTRDAIVALASRPASWGEANLTRAVTADDVFAAWGRPRTVQEG